jgi:Zn-dependent protease with chaperone function
MKTCNQCYFDSDDDDKFCTSCGAKHGIKGVHFTKTEIDTTNEAIDFKNVNKTANLGSTLRTLNSILHFIGGLLLTIPALSDTSNHLYILPFWTLFVFVFFSWCVSHAFLSIMVSTALTAKYTISQYTQNNKEQE